MMKKSLILAGLLFSTQLFADAKINIDVDLGGVGNILEKVGNEYYKAFYNDNGILYKSDIRLRGARGAHISGDSETSQGIDKIFNLVRGSLIPNDLTNIPKTIPISTNNSQFREINFKPGIQIYSSNNIQIKRGYLFSQEFLRFFNLNLLFNGVNNFVYNREETDDDSKIKEATLLLLLDKFNIRNFSMFYDNNVNSKYSGIINGLSNLEAMIDDKVKEKSYKDLLKRKINTIKALLIFSKKLYDTSSNARIRIPVYEIVGNNKVVKVSNDRIRNISQPFIEIFPTNEKFNNTLTYKVGRTHIKRFLSNHKYTSGYDYGYYWGYKIYHDKYGYYYYDNDDGYYWGKTYIPYYLVSPEEIKSNCSKIPSSNASKDVLNSFYKNCFATIDVNTVKNTVKNVFNYLNTSYEDMVNEIISKSSSSIGMGGDKKNFLKYLTNNIPGLTDIMMSFTQSYAIRDVNALYRKPADINMLDFMDDIQELVALEQFKYNKDLDALRKYPTAVSLSDFSNNSEPKVTQEELSQQIEDSVKLSNNDNGDNTINNSSSVEDYYVPLTPSSFITNNSETDNETNNETEENLLNIPSATTSDKAVKPVKMLLVYLNSFDKNGYPYVFNANSVNLINNYLKTNFDYGTISNYNIYAYGITDNNEKFFLGKSYLDSNEQYDYLINSFALFGIACTKVGDKEACSLIDRNVNDSSGENWIDIGEDNILHLYNLLIKRAKTLSNVIIDDKDLTATLNEITGVIIDTSTGETAQKLANILNGEDKNEAMEVDTFMPFKVNGLLVQTHYVLKHYVPKAITEKVCDKEGNCTEVVTGYTWQLVSTEYPKYSCNVAFQPASKIGTMLMSKIYSNYVNGELSSASYTYKPIGDVQSYDFAVLLTKNKDSKNSGTVIGGDTAIPYNYLKIMYGDNINDIKLSDADCLAHGLNPGCTQSQTGEVISCGEIENDDFWKSHAVIYTLNDINIPGIGYSMLIYRNDYQALKDKTKADIVDTDAAIIYAFDGKMPGIGEKGFIDGANPYKKIFIDGVWKDTVVKKTNEIDLGKTGVTTISDCNGKLYIANSCPKDDLPKVNLPAVENESKQINNSQEEQNKE